MFSPDSRNALKAFLLALLIVCAVAFLGSRAKADGPSKEDYQRLATIKQNQKVLQKTRDAHEQFVQAKQSNEELVRDLNADGWNIDWSSLSLVPFPSRP